MAKDKPKKPVNFVDLRQPVKQPRSSLIQDVLSPGKNRARAARYWRFLTVSVIVLGIAVFAWQALKPNNPLPSNLQKQIKFTTFLPVKLPADFKLLTKSYSIDNNVLTFEVNAPNNQQILVSEQTEPSNFDVDKFNQELIKNKQVKNVKYGTAYFGNQEVSQIGSLVSSGTWIFASEPKQVGNNSDLIKLMQALHKD